MSNPTQEYNDYIRANLPYWITYDEDRARYVTWNGKYFPTYLEAKWYSDYIIKFGADPSPASLFANGEQGAWYGPSDLTTLYQDAAGTTPVTADGDPVGYMADKSGNGNHATQSTAAARPTYNISPARITLDSVDDNMAIDFGETFTGTVIQGTPNGTIHMEIDVPGGAWNLTQDPDYVPDGGDITGLIAVEGTPLASEISRTKQYLQNNGAGTDFAGVTSMENWFYKRDDITAIYAGDWDTSSVTSFSRFVQGCGNLIILDVSNWDTSSVTDFGIFANNCPSLTTLDVSNWDTSSVTRFAFFVRFCSGLTTVTTEGGSGNPFADSPCTDYADAFTDTNLDQESIDNILVRIESAGTSNGTFDQSGGSAPSATGEAAIDALRARGWTVTVTGGY